MTQTIALEFEDNSQAQLLFGELHSNLTYLEKKLGVSIADRGNSLSISGTKLDVKNTKFILESLYKKLEERTLDDVSPSHIDTELRFIKSPELRKRKKMPDPEENNKAAIKTKVKTIAPRSPTQAAYLKSIAQHDMVFGLGPAGTGKTYLAVAAGVDMFLQGKVDRLIFCRPAVEAGENLGFLPGDMREKIDPYIRPIYDALHDMMPWDFMMKRMEAGDIEIAPLAFMRGRTLANSFVLLDEAQNSTCAQMKMFLTRMGENSRLVITGDLSQTDLPKGVKSGLNEAVDILSNIQEIQFTEFTVKDVIRHSLVQKIISAYDKATD
ncbi:MAG: PhoH family protein [Alphaproteobacteria bacterium]|nr:PhoH family protein [Alphaproteobacteria bacterium]